MATLMTRDAGNEGARLAPSVTRAVYELSTIFHLFDLDFDSTTQHQQTKRNGK